MKRKNIYFEPESQDSEFLGSEQIEESEDDVSLPEEEE